MEEKKKPANWLAVCVTWHTLGGFTQLQGPLKKVILMSFLYTHLHTLSTIYLYVHLAFQLTLSLRTLAFSFTQFLSPAKCFPPNVLLL